MQHFDPNSPIPTIRAPSNSVGSWISRHGLAREQYLREKFMRQQAEADTRVEINDERRLRAISASLLAIWRFVFHHGLYQKAPKKS